MRNWSLIIDMNKSGLDHMEADCKFLSSFNGSPILRIYSWYPPCISLGYSQDIDREIDVKKAAQLGWDVIKRPTGGGIVFHNEAEVTYSLVAAIDNPIFPKGLVPTYKKISEAIVYALQLLGVNAEMRNAEWAVPAGRQGMRNKKPSLCFSYPTEHEIVVNDKKIVGSAQKRGKTAFLQQGSIFIKPTDPKIFEVLKNQEYDVNAISVSDVLGRVPGFDEVSNALVKGFEQKLGIKL